MTSRKPVLITSLFVALSTLAVILRAEQLAEGVVHMAFLGDSGTGKEAQEHVRDQLDKLRDQGLLEFVFLLGDNIYPSGEGEDITPKFRNIYTGLLSQNVEFHAALGNHDVRKCEMLDVDPLPPDEAAYLDCDVSEHLDPRNQFGYQDGRRYYSITLPRNPPLVEVFVLDTNTLAIKDGMVAKQDRQDSNQLAWLNTALSQSTARWKVVTMHHPIHSPKASSGFLGLRGHGPEADLRAQLEPMFRAHKVDAVFAGHNHLYARIAPQGGVRYFVSGGGGTGVYGFTPATGYAMARADRGKFHHFVYVRVTEDAFQYCAIDTDFMTRDAGWFRKGDQMDSLVSDGACPF